MNLPDENYIDWKDWQDDAFGKFERLDAEYFAAETGIESGGRYRILEIGFGNGRFLGWLRSIGAEAFGVETNPMLAARACTFLGVERVFSDLFDERLNAFAGTLTHVVAFDVIEHIPQDRLPAFLSRMAQLLAADGRIILRFPNGDSPFGRIYQHGDPTHVTTLGRVKIEYFARLAGLNAAVVRAPALPVTGVGLLRGVRRRMMLIARRLCERAMSQLYFGGRDIPFDPNYTVVLVRAANGSRPTA
jgi:SAM-dependent methyltransferase